MERMFTTNITKHTKVKNNSHLAFLNFFVIFVHFVVKQMFSLVWIRIGNELPIWIVIVFQ